MRLSRPKLWDPWLSRRFFARLLSTLICAILVVVPPFARYGGPWAFLALTIKELVFSVQDNLAQQLELTVLNLLGGFFGIALSTLAKYLSTFPAQQSSASRGILAVFLVFTSFTAGWLKSRLPRLASAARISCFISIWMLTADVGGEQQIRREAINFAWIILTAAITSLLSGLIILRWTSLQFADDIVRAFSKLHASLSHNLDMAFDHDVPSGPTTLHDQLLKISVSLNQTYSQASFELRVGRVGVKSIRPLIGTIEHLRRELSWGTRCPRSSHCDTPLEKRVVQFFKDPATQLGNSVLESMKAVETAVSRSFDYAITALSMETEKAALEDALRSLHKTSVAAREELRAFCDDFDMQQRAADGAIGFPQQVFESCLFMISLLQMAHEMRHALHVAQNVISLYEISPPRLWHPRFSWAWLGVPPTNYVLEERGTLLDEDTSVAGKTTLSLEETLQGISENRYSATDDETRSVLQTNGAIGRPYTVIWISASLRRLWNHPRALRVRLRLSRAIRSMQHSPHLRHAVKNAAGVALLSIPAFLAVDSPGHSWFYWARGQWMIISFVWVLETNTGATWRIGYLRISGTIIGCIYAYITYLICRANPYGLVIMIAAAEFLVSWIIINTTFPSLGVVASVTLPPLVFASYFRLEPPISIIVLTILRGVMIAAGIVAALIMNSVFFPRHCRVMFLNSTSRTLGLLSQLYMALSRDLFSNAMVSSVLEKQKILKLELDIRNALHRMNILTITMNDELSLVPKPMQKYRKTVAVLQKLLDLLTGLRKVREKIPRKETVTAVVGERREFVSCVCVSLFACEQVFKARCPLPQFLPSSRQALHQLERSAEAQIQLARLEDSGSLGLSMVYAFAETDVLTEVVETLEELLELSRQLFGTSAWFDASPVNMLTPMTSMHEEVGQGV